MSKLGLNERQIDALVYFKSKGRVTSTEYAEKYSISDRTARRDLSAVAEVCPKLDKNSLAGSYFELIISQYGQL